MEARGLARRLNRRIRENRLLWGEVWQALRLGLELTPANAQGILMYSAAAGYGLGVGLALKMGASPFEPLVQVRPVTNPTSPGTGLYEDAAPAFWWQDDEEANIEPVTMPIQAAIAGRSPACLRLLLTGKNFVLGFGWLSGLPMNTHRVDAGLALVGVAHNGPEEKRYDNSIKCWLEMAEDWLCGEDPANYERETLALLHGRMCRAMGYFCLPHRIPLNHNVIMPRRNGGEEEN